MASLIAAAASSSSRQERAARGARARARHGARQWRRRYHAPLALSEAQALEPALACTGALLSPSTGILDSHAFMLALLGDAQAHGAMIAYGSTVSGGRVDENGVIIDVAFGGRRHAARAAPPRELRRARSSIDRRLDRRLAAARRSRPCAMPRAIISSFSAARPSRASSTRCPSLAGSACISRIDLGGQAKFGPDVEWIERLDYSVDAARGARFYAAIRQYWPGLPDEALVPGYAGIRPKIPAHGDAMPDFVIQGKDDHGVEGLINLYGIELPGPHLLARHRRLRGAPRGIPPAPSA